MSSKDRIQVAQWLHILQAGDDPTRIRAIQRIAKSRLPIRALLPLLETALRDSNLAVRTLAAVGGFQMGWSLSTEDVHALEGIIEAGAEDQELNLMARILLISHHFYSHNRSDRSEMTKKCFVHVRFIIENAPDSEAAGPVANVCFESADSVEYQIAKELWKNHLAREPENTSYLKNAAEFYEFFEPQLRRDCLTKGQSLEPWNPYWQMGLAADEKDDDDAESWTNLN